MRGEFLGYSDTAMSWCWGGIITVMTYASFVIIFWFIFILYWGISAIGVKKDIRRGSSWWINFCIRVVLIIALIWVLNLGIFSSFWVSANSLPFFSNPIIQTIGVIFAGAGIAFAIWARRNLGRNWSGTPQIKVGHELVTSGPYRFVRHPIYTGMITALFGSALVGGPSWCVAFIIFTIVFIMRIKKEEKFMMQLFPDQYPAYRARTKAIVPFVW